MKTSIIYNSHSGTTKTFAEEIGKFLAEKGVDHRVSSIEDYDKEYLLTSDIVLLGCWTSGLMIFAQHPNGAWKKFAKDMPAIKEKSVALFTTYKLATGSMFRKMESKLAGKIDQPKAFIRSKNDMLTDEHKSLLESLIKN